MFEQKAHFVLIAVFSILALVVLTADFVLLVRWVLYTWAVQRYDDTVAAHAPSPNDPAPENRPDLPEPPKRAFKQTWSLVDPFVGFQLANLSQVLIVLALLPILLSRGINHMMEMLTSLPAIVVQSLGIAAFNGIMVAIVAWYVRRYQSSLPEIGFGMPSARLLGLGLAFGAVLFVGALAFEKGLSFGMTHILPAHVVKALADLNQSLTAGGMFESIHSLSGKILFALAGSIAAPIGEEVFFRGFLYNSLKRRMGVTAGIVLSGLIFGLVHFGPLAILVIFPMGMALAYVYEKTGSLWITITMHAVNNGVTFAIAILWPNLLDGPKPVPRPAPPPRQAVIRNIGAGPAIMNNRCGVFVLS